MHCMHYTQPNRFVCDLTFHSNFTNDILRLQLVHAVTVQMFIMPIE